MFNECIFATWEFTFDLNARVHACLIQLGTSICYLLLPSYGVWTIFISYACAYQGCEINCNHFFAKIGHLKKIRSSPNLKSDSDQANRCKRKILISLTLRIFIETSYLLYSCLFAFLCLVWIYLCNNAYTLSNFGIFYILVLFNLF